MAVPKQRKTKSRRNQRRMHIFLKKPALILCSNCKKGVRPHNVCVNCGYYKGKEVVNVLAGLTRKERKRREKEIKMKESSEGREKVVTMEELSKKIN